MRFNNCKIAWYGVALNCMKLYPIVPHKHRNTQDTGHKTPDTRHKTQDRSHHSQSQKYSFEVEEADMIASFLLPMLDLNPNMRATAADALQHPWLASLDVENDNVLTPAELEAPKRGSDDEGDDSQDEEEVHEG